MRPRLRRPARAHASTSGPTTEPDGRSCHGHLDVVPGHPEQFTPAHRGRPADRPRRLRHEGRAGGDDVRAARRRRPGPGARALRLRARRGVRGRRAPLDRRPGPPTAARATSRSRASRPTCTSASRPRACSPCGIVVHGRAAHGSTPWLGDNAILKALDVFRRIETLPFSRESSDLFDRPSINLARIAGRRRVQQGARRLHDGRRHPLPAQPGPERDPRARSARSRTSRSRSTFMRAPAVVSRRNPYVRALRDGGGPLDQGEALSVGRDGASRRGLVPRGGRPGGRVRPGRRRPPRAATSGSRSPRCAATARRWATSSRQLPAWLGDARAAAPAAARRRRRPGVARGRPGATRPPPNRRPRAAQARPARERARRSSLRAAAPTATRACSRSTTSPTTFLERRARAPVVLPRDRRRRRRRARDDHAARLRRALRATRSVGPEPRSDTIILVRARPRQGRDRGHVDPARPQGRDPRRTARTRSTPPTRSAAPRLTLTHGQEAASRTPTSEDFPINHVVNVNFGGFRRAVNCLGCVYVDIDRDYFNDNSGRRRATTPTIDVDRGLPEALRPDALDYVRYRHFDNDLVRAARQQDFLRQARSQSGVTKLLRRSASARARAVFGRYIDDRQALRATRRSSRLLKLALYLVPSNPVQEVRFRADETDDPQIDTACTPRRASSSRRRRRVHERAELRQAHADRQADAAGQGVRSAGAASATATARRPRARGGARAGRGPAVRRSTRSSNFPFYFPRLRTTARATPAPTPRTYTIRDERRQASTTPTGSWSPRAWSASTTASRARRGRRRRSSTTRPRRARSASASYELFYDGDRLRLVAWKTQARRLLGVEHAARSR